MEQLTNYIKPELLVVSIALYFIGMGLKKAQAVKDKYIPLILGAVGIMICAFFVFSTSPLGTPQEISLAVFTTLVQGILVAGASTYVNQVVKQLRKEE